MVLYAIKTVFAPNTILPENSFLIYSVFIPISDFVTLTMATKATKCKRYNGRPYNVRDNVFFENYMEEVAKGMVSLIHARLS